MKTILATDGSKNIRLLLEAELSLEGYEVILASTWSGNDEKDERDNPRLTSTGFENARYA